MRRDNVTLDVKHAGDGGDELPTVELTVDEPTDLLGERLATPSGERLDGSGIDAAFRLQSAVEDEDVTGVFSISNRVTGEFVLEVNADATAVLDLVEVARRDNGDAEACYRVVVRRDDEDAVAFEKRTLLVYDDQGSLLRQHSLIPSGVEL